LSGEEEEQASMAGRRRAVVGLEIGPDLRAGHSKKASPNPRLARVPYQFPA